MRIESKYSKLGRQPILHPGRASSIKKPRARKGIENEESEDVGGGFWLECCLWKAVRGGRCVLGIDA